MNGSLKLAWSDELSTGNKAIDVQHKYLIDIINELGRAIETKTAETTIKKVLNLLQHYTEWHFGREELCMERTNCPAACANAEAHGHFIEMVKAFREEYNRSGGAAEIALRMYNALTDWLVNHIMKVDGQLAAYSKNDRTNVF